MNPKRPSRPSVPVDVMPHVRHALDLMHRNYAEPLDLDALAAEAGVSKYHFRRRFAATYGQTPAQYLRHRRIERARDLLRATDMTVTEICNLLGFSSLGSFSARFHEQVCGRSGRA
jgi:transcriptional regulator GlxA family with amidase domain